MGFVSVTIQILCDILVILLVLQGKVRMATLVGASNLIACVTNGLHEFANLRMSLVAGRPYFEKLTAERQETGPVRSLPPLHDAIRMEGISFAYGEKPILRRQDFVFSIGKKYALTGPSGCGKSTILRMIGGLEDITSGEIYLGKELLNDILPRDRRLAMAFQNYTLYKHMNVYDNMALGLRLRDLPRPVIDSRVKSAAQFLGISDILTSKLRAISDSQRQRVALGRAIVCQPKVLLVDEDFARQDDDRRREMLEDILRINSELGITVLYVTNDYEEAVSLGKRIVYMKDGRIVDFDDIYN